MIIKSIASGSKGNAYYVSDGRTPLLIECGIPLKEIQKGIDFTLSEIDGVLISHQHNDHCKALRDVVKFGVDVFAPAEVFNSKQVCGHRCTAVKPFEGFTIGSFFILPFNCEHDCVNYGYLICSRATSEKLLYFTDTYFVRYKFIGITHIMAECNYSIDALNESVARGYISSGLRNRILTSHMSIERLLDFLKQNDISKVRQIYLIHLSDNNSCEIAFKQAIQEITGNEVYVF